MDHLSNTDLLLLKLFLKASELVREPKKEDEEERVELTEPPTKQICLGSLTSAPNSTDTNCSLSIISNQIKDLTSEVKDLKSEILSVKDNHSSVQSSNAPCKRDF